MTLNITQDELDDWESDLNYAQRKFGKSGSFPSAQDRVRSVRDEIRSADPEDVDKDTISEWKSSLDYAHRKFSKSLDFPRAQDRVYEVKVDMSEYLN